MITVVYTSGTGYTEQYATLLATRLGTRALPLDEARRTLERGSNIVYLGWIRSDRIMGYSDARRFFTVLAIGAVGMSDPAAADEEDNRAHAEEVAEGSVTDSEDYDPCYNLNMLKAALVSKNDIGKTPLFFLRGGFCFERLRGFNRFMMKMVRKSFAGCDTSDPNMRAQDKSLMLLLEHGGSCVREENLDELCRLLGF